MCAAISVGEKMASARNDHLMKQRSVIEFLTAEGCSAVVIHKRMKAVYGDACLTEESKMQSMQYRHKNSPAPKKFKVVASARKVLLTIFWDMEGIVHVEFLEQGTTINSERYVSTLRALKGRLRRVRQDKVKDVVIQQDNAQLHTSCQTLPHPPYSPDLAPSDFFLFPLLKKHLKGNHYETDAEVEADVPSWCRSQTPEFFADGMRKLVQRWRLCIERDGDYVEK
ncbi:transposase [Elysia marginata]|uniref:Transposase n=1 Tax=Elysia marginata TaxID=1093978 RepID=A0AAV4JKZ0_9GAST|nr:transposase [Elysia marginata]